MINIENLLDGIVAALRDIPALVTLLGNADKISAYKDLHPDATSVYKAIFEMKPGTVLVVYDLPGRGIPNEGYFRHRIRFIIQFGPNFHPLAILPLLYSGIVTSSGLPFILTTVDGNGQCFTPPDIGQGNRITNPEKMDYFELPLYYAEIGLT